MVKNDEENTVFHKIFDYIIGTNSYYNYRNAGLNSLNLSLIEKSTFEELYIVLLIIILIPIVVISILYMLVKKGKKIKNWWEDICGFLSRSRMKQILKKELNNIEK